MIFLVDAQLPPALAVWLRSKGKDAYAVRDVGLRDASDADIWKHALQDGAIIVTKDEDFVRLAATDLDGPRVLWVRVGNVLNRTLLSRFEAVWPELQTHIQSSARIIEVW